ncbi:MAG: tRNA threonylcarbamoyladenosine biosynthesis protein TsaB [Candidatus Anoxychlamydiales bacterium]|nr:tRNA threonylcarbamoyladenosine biosynthesis protein TsaB [Candidatus Anoxychlamydiales bacterium]NGX40825.1 tRNA threonylcarbamoyladenosine biosynthesis protein TsaB [Candidatus Anoxychlamydiales bacterium]HEU64038.1 tRNA (adenosine(37)-N6)-threonylcarbamoyltransferase complex dimerization subunit type 1 TsaB [Chlamydiota bacterium]
MKALIIDTTLETSYIILIEDNEIIFLKKIKNNLSKNLFLDLQNILNETNTTLPSLSYIATSIGPGSFTSLRVGANISKTFSYVKKIPLISYISMHAYSPDEDSKFLVAFDAKSEGLYLVEAEKSKNFIKYLSEPSLFSFNKAKELIEKNEIVISPHADVLKNKFETNGNKFEFKELDPLRLIDITNKKYIEKKIEDYTSFNLLYLRGPKIVE